MKFVERKEIIEGFKYVNQVIAFNDSDDTANEAIRNVYDMFDYQNKEYNIYFANGGDRKKGNVPELDICRDLNVTMLWGIGGGKIQSSSWLIDGGKDER